MSDSKAPSYKKNDDLANLEALKEEMFSRAFGPCWDNTQRDHGAFAAEAYANLVRAQVALKGSANPRPL